MDVADLFNRYSHKKVCVLLNVGNKGDGLIHMGGRTLLDKYRVQYEEIHYPEERSGKTLFVYGCGAFSIPHHHMVKMVGFYMDKFEEIVILPASFDTDSPTVRRFLATLPDKVVVFCRERYSYALAGAVMKHRENLFLDKDLAFHIDYSKWSMKGKGVLISFNTSPEESSTIDISRIPSNKDCSLGKQDQGNELLEELGKYETIYTNRAHNAISCALMGKNVYMCEASYHKLRGIYEEYLAEMSNVRWMDDNDISALYTIKTKWDWRNTYHKTKRLVRKTKWKILARLNP